MSQRRSNRRQVMRIHYGTVVIGGEAFRQGSDVAVLACGHQAVLPRNVFRTPGYLRCKQCEQQPRQGR